MELALCGGTERSRGNGQHVRRPVVRTYKSGVFEELKRIQQCGSGAVWMCVGAERRGMGNNEA